MWRRQGRPRAAGRALAFSLGALAWAGGGIARPESAEGFRVIVAAGSPISDLKREEVARIFLKKQTQWKDGREIAPVDQPAQSAVRAAFARDVLAMEGLEKISAVESYWRQQMDSGGAAPPAVKTGDDDVRQFVAETPGAIGYVSAKADLTGVKAVKVQD